MPLMFEQTKDRNGKPSWFVRRSTGFGHPLGRVEHLGEYRFRAGASQILSATELREIADFIEEAH